MEGYELEAGGKKRKELSLDSAGTFLMTLLVFSRVIFNNKKGGLRYGLERRPGGHMETMKDFNSLQSNRCTHLT